jgi:hypothetical protein
MRSEIDNQTSHYEELKRRTDHLDAMPVVGRDQPINFVMIGDQISTVRGEEGQVIELLPAYTNRKLRRSHLLAGGR